MPPVFTASRLTLGNALNNLDTLQNINTIQDFQNEKTVLLQSVTDLRSHVQDQDTQINTLSATINQREATIAGLTTQNNQFQQDITAKQKQIDDLNSRLAAATASPSAKPLDVATSFKNVVDQIQQQAQQAAGSMATTIQGLELNLKALVSVQENEPVLVMPTAAAPLDPNQLSNVRLTFASIPRLATPPAAAPPGVAAPAVAAPAVTSPVAPPKVTPVPSPAAASSSSAPTLKPAAKRVSAGRASSSSSSAGKPASASSSSSSSPSSSSSSGAPGAMSSSAASPASRAPVKTAVKAAAKTRASAKRKASKRTAK